MTNFQSLQLQIQPSSHISTLTISSTRSALGPNFWRELPLALQTCQQEKSRVLIVRGQEMFSAGLDLQNTPFAEMQNQARMLELVSEMQQAIESIAALPIPVIAAVHGPCIGAGLELAAACDFRICSHDARFILPEVKLGIVADLGALQRLPRLIGFGRATHLALTGEAIDASTAEHWGLVTQVWPSHQELFEQAQQLAQNMAALPSGALSGSKQVLQDQLKAVTHSDSLRHALDRNVQNIEQLLTSLAQRN